jgi:Zn-dependent protease with chaperone function
LAAAAYASQPGLKDRVPAFTFTVAEKSEVGTTSDADGNIVIYRAAQGVNETVLAFLIAREMGHVIARHHDEKSAATVVASVIVRLLLPATNLVGGVALLAGTAASAVGANAMGNDDDPRKTQEATTIATNLMARKGWSSGEVRTALSRYAATLGDDAWGQSVKVSLAALDEADLRRELLALHP